MSKGKLIAMGVVAFLVWENQAAIMPRLDTLRDAVPRLRSYMEMRSYSGDLMVYIEKEGAPPPQLGEWLEARFPPKTDRAPSVDFFGNPYRVDRDRTHGWVLRSCGPDAVCLSEDDLILPLMDRARRRTVDISRGEAGRAASR